MCPVYTFNSLFHLELMQWTRTPRKIFKIILDVMYSYLIFDREECFTIK